MDKNYRSNIQSTLLKKHVVHSKTNSNFNLKLKIKQLCESGSNDSL